MLHASGCLARLSRQRPPNFPALPCADTLCTTYVVQSGDSLWSISNKFGVLQDDLVAALESCLSGWTSSTALQVGQRICLPGYVPACDYVINSGGYASGAGKMRCVARCALCMLVAQHGPHPCLPALLLTFPLCCATQVTWLPARHIKCSKETP